MSDDIGTALSAPGSPLRLWAELPVGEFVRLDDTQAFARDHLLVVAKRREVIPNVPVEHVSIGALQFCRLGLLACAGVPVAYVLTSGRCLVRVRRQYCTWSVRGEQATSGTSLFQDGTLGVVGDDRAVVAFIGERRWTRQS